MRRARRHRPEAPPPFPRRRRTPGPLREFLRVTLPATAITGWNDRPMVRRRVQPPNIIVQGRRFEVTDPLRRYAHQKLGKLTRHFDQIKEVQVVLSVEKDRRVGKAQVVEVTVWGDGLVLRGEHAGADMRGSIDAVVDKLETQIQKYRSRLIEKRRIDAARTKRRQVATAEAALRGAPAAAPGVEIVRIKRFAMKPMTPEDAVLQMDLLGHGFFVFRNMQTDEVNVVYRRRTGDYGLIEPE